MPIRNLFFKVAISILFICSSAQAQQNPFTLEQILNSGFPSDLVAAPSGGKVAWVLNVRGVRNVWVAEPPDYKGRPITSYNEDDGQEIAELRWAPNARAIVYVRGGGFGNVVEYPNPRSLPAGTEQAMWIISLDSQPPRRLGEGHSPAISPKDDRVAFVYKKQISWVKTDGSEKAELLIQAKGEGQSLRWSPDGSKLAFVSNRGDHSYIGAYDWSTKTIRYFDPSVDRDNEPVWSRDGTRIGFIRIPASTEAVRVGPERTGHPWSIRVADVESGNGREIWRADKGQGSMFREVVADNQLLWGTDDRLVFPWEKDGWTHLYSISTSTEASKGQAMLLTPGGFEVEHVSLTPDGKDVLFSSNQDDINRRHLWRVPVTSGKPVAITKGGGIEWSPVVTGDEKTIAFLRSDARLPARAAIIASSAQARDLSPEAISADFPTTSLIDPQPVTFSSADGMKIHGQLFLPSRRETNQRHPAVIFFHGGSQRQMLLGWHYRYYYHNAYALNQFLASRGYVVLSVNYRSGIGYGLEFREALNYGAAGASEFNDVLGAGLFLRNHPEVDPQRIGLWGGSYGGYLTALGLARASDLFAAGVDIHGVHDWNAEIHHWVSAYDPLASPDRARIAFESSPLASVKTWRSPVLLIHGDDDRNVPFSETIHLVAALREQEVECEQLIIPDELHDFLTYSHWLEVYRATVSFLDRHLRN